MPTSGRPVEDSTRPCQGRAVAKMDGLRELDDGPAWEIVDHSLAEPLEPWPEIPEIAAALEQDEAVRTALLENLRVVVTVVTAVRDAHARLAEPGQLAQPDGAVAHVGGIIEADQRALGAAAHDRLERGPDPVTQGGDRLLAIELSRAFRDQHGTPAVCIRATPDCA